MGGSCHRLVRIAWLMIVIAFGTACGTSRGNSFRDTAETELIHDDSPGSASTENPKDNGNVEQRS